MRTGNQAIFEQLIADGFEYLFGLPGSEEEGFLDAMSDFEDRIKYILAYQETVAVMAADAYARATGKTALVQVHSTPGLGNALGGAIWEAAKGHSPMVVLGGKAGLKYLPMDAHMAGDVVAMAKPITKWAGMVTHSSSLLRMLRRAIVTAGTPPKGPVYLCLPMDVLDEPVAETVVPTHLPSTRVKPDSTWIRGVADQLADAETPMIFVGDGVVESQAQEELAEVAELLGAEVWGAHLGDLAMSHAHALYRGLTGRMFGASSRPIWSKGDASLIVGTYVASEVFPDVGDVFAAGSKVFHIDLVAENIGKNHPLTSGVVSDPKSTLASLAECLRRRATTSRRMVAEKRLQALSAQKQAERQQALAEDQTHRDRVPMPFSRVAEEIADQLREQNINDPVIFDEALTCSPALTRHIVPTRARHYFLPRGGCLGIGLPGAIGAQLGHPTKMVIGVTGDGAAMEVIQGLATAARYQIGAKFVICNNRSYKVCVDNLNRYRQDHGASVLRKQPNSFDLAMPLLDFVKLANGQGVPAARVEKPADLKVAVREMLTSKGPFLLDAVVA